LPFSKAGDFFSDGQESQVFTKAMLHLQSSAFSRKARTLAPAARVRNPPFLSLMSQPRKVLHRRTDWQKGPASLLVATRTPKRGNLSSKGEY
jgi:hypothetical protein